MKTLYLVRHGSVDYSTKEYSLSEEGQKEVSQLGKDIEPEREILFPQG